MCCPMCFGKTKVIDSRHSEDDDGVNRKRKCLNCGYTFRTVEVESEWLDKRLGIKKDGNSDD